MDKISTLAGCDLEMQRLWTDELSVSLLDGIEESR